GAKLSGSHSHKTKIGPGLGVGNASRFKHRRCMQAEFFEITGSPEHEHAGVPVIGALGQVALCDWQRRLFDELTDAIRVLSERFASLDIAEAGFRAIRLDAKRYQPILIG